MKETRDYFKKSCQGLDDKTTRSSACPFTVNSLILPSSGESSGLQHYCNIIIYFLLFMSFLVLLLLLLFFLWSFNLGKNEIKKKLKKQKKKKKKLKQRICFFSVTLIR